MTIKKEQLLDEIHYLARRIYCVKNKDYFETRIRNMIETYIATLEDREVLEIEDEE